MPPDMVEKLSYFKHLCETEEELALYEAIVPKRIRLDRDTYKRWVELHPDTKLTAPAVALWIKENVVLSEAEENIWKTELEADEDKEIFALN